MSKIDELMRARSLLSQAISAAANSMPNDRSVQEAKIHMKKALNEIDTAAKAHTRKQKSTQDQYQQWWGNVTAGVGLAAHTPMSSESQHKSLAQLNSMIENEQKKLDDLEKASIKPDPLTDLLRD